MAFNLKKTKGREGFIPHDLFHIKKHYYFLVTPRGVEPPSPE